jgi:lipopolysaccharide export system permease protein
VRAPRDLASSLKPSTIASYIAREFAFSFLIAFLFFFVVFFVNQLLLMAEDILSRRAPLRDVLLLLFYSMPSEIAMAFPFASLVGALMAAGRFASDNEMLVFQACGIPARRIFLPFAILGLVFSLVSFVMNDYYLPLGNIEFGKVYRKLIISTPAVELKPWSVRRYRDVTIVTGAEEKGIIKDILIFDTSEEGRERLISAKRAGISEGADSDEVVALKLDGVLVQILVDKDPERFEYSSCASMTYRIDLRDSGGIVSSIGPSSMSSVDLSREIGEKQRAFDARRLRREGELAVARAKLEEAYEGAELGALAWPNAQARISPALSDLRAVERSSLADRSLQTYRLEYYKKFAIPFGAFFFVILAFPLGLKARRAGRSVGFGLGLLVAVAYWALLLGGQTFGTRLGWSPFWSMWAPNAFVLVAGIACWLWDGLLL